MQCKDSQPYRPAGAGAPAISRLSPILHLRPGPELRQEGRQGQWLSGSRPHNRIMLEIGPGPLSHSARRKNTQDPTDMSSISNTSQRKRRRGGGSTEGGRNNCLLGLPPKPSAWGHWLVWPSSLFLHPLILDVSLQHYKNNYCITGSFSAAPARLHCLHHTFHS